MPESNPAAAKAVILLVDDEADMRKVLGRRIASWGYEVVEAADGEDAIRLTDVHHPHCILMDLLMPTLDGLGACRRLKAAEATRHIPVLVLTAKDSRTLEADVQAAGADGLLRKPCDPVQLQQLIQQMLARP